MYLMTQSLISSWLYAMKENPYADATTEDTAKDDFLAVLRREPTKTSEAMQSGIDFENLITSILAGDEPKEHDWYDAAFRVASKITGAQLQVPIKREETIDGTQILLYGRVDALRAGVIYDIKYTSHYEVGKYFDSPQHPMYLSILPDAYAFEYLASDGRNVWPERYSRDEARDIVPLITDFLRWIKSVGLYEVYAEKWLSL